MPSPGLTMIWLYRLLFLPTLLIAAPRYLARMRRRGGYRVGFGERFGQGAPLRPRSPCRRRIWVQAVSVGEILAIGPILEALHRDGVDVYLTTTTSTGMQLARERYAALVSGLGYFPIDWWPFSARAWKRISPDLVILVEGERWPEHLHQATLRRIPVVYLNARVSDRSFKRMRRLTPFLGLILGESSHFLAASPLDESRLLTLGVNSDRVFVTGNIKLDVRIPTVGSEELVKLRRELGLPEGLVLLGASTWDGEEAALLECLKHARASGLRCSLLLVPRHAERRTAIEGLLRAAGLRCHLRSRGPATQEVDVAIADTTGELRRLTQVADLVFIGKSLAPHTEGQTPVEAAALGKPIILGNGMSNFRTIAAELVARNAAYQVASPNALAEVVVALLRDQHRREMLSQAAAEWHRTNAGAIERALGRIMAMLGQLT